MTHSQAKKQLPHGRLITGACVVAVVHMLCESQCDFGKQRFTLLLLYSSLLVVLWAFIKSRIRSLISLSLSLLLVWERLGGGGSLTALIRFCWRCADVISQRSREKSAEEHKKHHFLLVYWLERERARKALAFVIVQLLVPFVPLWMAWWMFSNCHAWKTL